MKRMLEFIAVICISCCAYAQPSPKEIRTTAQKDLIPEGIVVDSKTGTIYISSIAQHKIVAIDASGNARDFIQPGEGNYLEGLGMKIDKKRNWLWALSNKEDRDSHSVQVHAFGISDGKSKQYYIIKDTNSRLFNDLTIANDGKIYCTDTFFGAIYEVDPITKKIKLLIRDSLTAEPNGIVMGKNDLLYIATYKHGLITYNLQTRKLSQLEGYKDSLVIRNLDGLDLSGNLLFGVYNGDTTNKTNAIVVYKLDPSGTRIQEEKIVDRGNPVFQEPTTLAIANGKAYLLANSNLGPYYANKQSVNGIDDKIAGAVILVYQVDDLRK